MATYKTTFAGVMSALAFLLFTAGLSAPANAYYAQSCTYASELPCLGAGNDNEDSVEASLFSVFGYFVDVMQIDKADGTPMKYNSTVNGSNGLSVKGTYFNGDKEGVFGYFNYVGPEEIAYVTIKAGNNYVIYDFAELVQNGVNYWSTQLLNWKGLSHLTIWKKIGSTRVPEPAPLALMLMGMGFLIWRRSRKVGATA